MNTLGKFIQDEMDKRGWKQIDLVRASGLTKQRVSWLLSTDLHRMIEAPTIAGLAQAFGMDPRKIQLKAAEAAGLSVEAPIVRTADDESDETLLEILLQRRRAKDRRPSGEGGAPNIKQGADNEAGDSSSQVSGGQQTTGDLRDPRRRSRGSDETHVERSAPQHAHPHLL